MKDKQEIEQKYKREVKTLQDRCSHKKIRTIKNEAGEPICDECIRCEKIVKTITQYALEC